MRACPRAFKRALGAHWTAERPSERARAASPFVACARRVCCYRVRRCARDWPQHEELCALRAQLCAEALRNLRDCVHLDCGFVRAARKSSHSFCSDSLFADVVSDVLFIVATVAVHLCARVISTKKKNHRLQRCKLQQQWLQCVHANLFPL